MYVCVYLMVCIYTLCIFYSTKQQQCTGCSEEDKQITHVQLRITISGSLHIHRNTITLPVTMQAYIEIVLYCLYTKHF